MTDARREETDAHRAAARDTAARDAGARCLRSPDGTALLLWLEARWGRRLPGATAEQMQANAGAMEVLSLLRRLRDTPT